jgi:hypothetical protein
MGIAWSGEYDESGYLSKETGRPGIDKGYLYDALRARGGGEAVERYRYGKRGKELVFTDGNGHDYTQSKNAYGELAGEVNRLNARQGYAYVNNDPVNWVDPWGLECSANDAKSGNTNENTRTVYEYSVLTGIRLTDGSYSYNSVTTHSLTNLPKLAGHWTQTNAALSRRGNDNPTYHRETIPGGGGFHCIDGVFVTAITHIEPIERVSEEIPEVESITRKW